MVLQSIYEKDLKVEDKQSEKTTVLSITLYPATGQDLKLQYVMVQLKLQVPNEILFSQAPHQYRIYVTQTHSILSGKYLYPDAALTVDFQASRGLSDDHLHALKLKMMEHIESNQGSSILYDLIELAKDSLTSNNLPYSPCPICLQSFQVYDEFLKTDCFHYYHCFCLYQYLLHHTNSNDDAHPHECLPANTASANSNVTSVPCPVCRIMISLPVDVVQNAKEPVNNEITNVDMSNLKRKREALQQIYRMQKERGGIIDIKTEQKKNWLSTLQKRQTDETATKPSTSTSGLQVGVSRTEDSRENYTNRQLQNYHRRMGNNKNKHMYTKLPPKTSRQDDKTLNCGSSMSCKDKSNRIVKLSQYANRTPKK
ncbi:E3 ubiquitin-protein ligase RNF25-like isoform X2 [Clavelina lepadiformis]